MFSSQLLVTMSAALSDADLNAIRKARGFSIKETDSRDSFASFFVSSIGVQEVMQQLTQEESITLHLLHQVGDVDISFFERLYGSARQLGKSYYGTFTQQFRPTFDAVKKNLVRKGLLIMAAVKISGESVQMERWRFAFPPEFLPYLPPILQTKEMDQIGEVNDWILRKKLLQILGGEPAVADDLRLIRIDSGTIYLGEDPFTVAGLTEWQTLVWNNALGGTLLNVKTSINPVDAIRDLFVGISPGEWVSAKSIEPVLKIYCFGNKISSVEKIFRQGWELGVLSRIKIDSEFYYRLAPQTTVFSKDDSPSSYPWLQISSDRNAVAVDLRLIPFDQLELLNKLACLKVEDSMLFASPDLVKLGRSDPEQRQSPLMHWLKENLSNFRDALILVNERWGMTLLHENLLVARVRDLSLRINLERELGSKLIVLSEHFIAFPPEVRPSIERVLRKSGFVIKTIKSKAV